MISKMTHTSYLSVSGRLRQFHSGAVGLHQQRHQHSRHNNNNNNNYTVYKYPLKSDDARTQITDCRSQDELSARHYSTNVLITE